MEHQIKTLAEAISHTHTKNLIQSHVKELRFDNNHLTIYVDNAHPLHELEDKECDRPLRNALEKVYGEDITYEIKLHQKGMHEREKEVPHNINQ